MSTENILGIVGLGVTIALGYLRLRSTSLNRRNTEIIFLKNASISLFKTIVKNLDEMEIKFRGSKINENLILFKGTFFNSGNVDIQRMVVHKPLEIELPSGYTWISHKIIDTSVGLELNASVDENKLVFRWDLLKEGEYFTFDSLVEYKSPKGEVSSDIERRLTKSLKINHRITDLKRINREVSIPRPTHFGNLIFMSICILGVVGIFFYLSFGQLLFPRYQLLNGVRFDSASQYVRLKADGQNEVVLVTTAGNTMTSLDVRELQGKLNGTISIVEEPFSYFALIFFGLFSVVYFIGWIFVIVNTVKERRLYAKLKIVADKHDEQDFDRPRRGQSLFFGFRFR